MYIYIYPPSIPRSNIKPLYKALDWQLASIHCCTVCPAMLRQSSAARLSARETGPVMTGAHHVAEPLKLRAMWVANWPWLPPVAYKGLLHGYLS